MGPQNNNEQWAESQLRLGTSSLDRMAEDPTMNLERAITAFNNAKTVFTRPSHPEKWGRIMLDLGTSYALRTTGGRQQNLNQAIRCFLDALQVYTHDRYPHEWAECQEGLGKAYFRQDNVLSRSVAVEHFQLALETLTRNESPEVWHTIHFYLSLAYGVFDPEIVPSQCELASKHYALAFDFDKNLYPALFSSLNSLAELHKRHAALRAELKQEKGERPVSDPSSPKGPGQ
jgi:hypothetical protein